MTSYQRLKEERDEYANLFTIALTDLQIAKDTLWEIASLKDGEEWKAPKWALDALRILKNENTKKR